MSDITKCEGTDCPLRYSCYRFLAPKNSYYQSYLKGVPYRSDSKSCPFFWDRKKN